MKHKWKHGGLWLVGMCLCAGCTAPRPETALVHGTDKPVSETIAVEPDVSGGHAPNAVDALTDAGLSIGIDRNGKIFVDNREIPPERLVETLEKSGVPKHTSIRVLAHPHAPFEHVVAVVTPIRNAGYTRVAVDIAE